MPRYVTPWQGPLHPQFKHSPTGDIIVVSTDGFGFRVDSHLIKTAR